MAGRGGSRLTRGSEIPMKMLLAARDGDVATIRRLLREGVDGKPVRVDAANAIGQTPLHFAAMWGHAHAVLALLDAGCNVNIENDDGQTPLYFAVRKGQVEVIRVLLNRGAKIKRLRSMLQMAKGVPREVEVLATLRLYAGASNVISQAVTSLNLDELETLIDAGKLHENETWEDPAGRTPLHYAVRATITVVEQRLERGEEDPFSANDGLAALEMLVLALEACGEEVVPEACDEVDEDGYCPLHYLAQAGRACHPAAMALLLRAGADPNVQSEPTDGEYTSGQWGRKTTEGEMEVIRGAPDRAPLHMALEADEPNAAMVELLLEFHADPNVRDNEQRTALHLALDFEDDRGGINLPMAELLLRKGADPSLGSLEIGMTNSCLHAAASSNEVEVIKLLLKYGAPHSAPGKGGWTALAMAVRCGGSETVEALLAAGADPELLTPSGKSVRELAALNKKDDVIKALDTEVTNLALC